MRLSIDQYFMKIAKTVALRSTCLRRQVGAVIVKDKQIITTGYNGAPSGIRDCLEMGCIRDKLNIESGTCHEICKAVHAEQNAIIQGALHGVSTKDSILYCTHQPCILCAKMIVNAGITKVVYGNGYPDEEANNLFSEAGIETLKLRM